MYGLATIMIIRKKGRIPQRKNETNFRIRLDLVCEGMEDRWVWFDKNYVRYDASMDVQVGTNPLNDDKGIQNLGILPFCGGPRHFVLKVTLPPQGQTTIVWKDERGLHYTATVNVCVELANQPEFVIRQVVTNPEGFHDFWGGLGFSRGSLPRNPEDVDSPEINKLIDRILRKYNSSL